MRTIAQYLTNTIMPILIIVAATLLIIAKAIVPCECERLKDKKSKITSNILNKQIL